MIPLDNSREQSGKVSPIHPEIVDFLLDAFQKNKGLPFNRRQTPGLDLVIDDLYRLVHGIEKHEHSHAMSEAARQWACTNSTDPRVGFVYQGELLRLSNIDSNSPSCFSFKIDGIPQALLECAAKCREYYEEIGEELPVLGLGSLKKTMPSGLTGAFANKNIGQEEEIFT